MRFAILMEFVAIGLIVYFVVLQVFVPLLQGTVLFPFFRRKAVAKEKELREALRAARQAELEAELMQEVKEAQERVAKVVPAVTNPTTTTKEGE